MGDYTQPPSRCGTPPIYVRVTYDRKSHDVIFDIAEEGVLRIAREDLGRRTRDDIVIVFLSLCVIYLLFSGLTDYH